MDETLVSRLTDEVLSRLQETAPQKLRAFCIGQAPQNAPFLPVTEKPYDAVVLCTLSPAALLQMPSDEVCRALLEGVPVYLMEEGLEHRKYASRHGRALMAELMAKERHLRNLGVLLWNSRQKKLYTVQDVQRLGRAGIPSDARLTPLAREMLEGL